MTDFTSILLTYKGKVLLTFRESTPNIINNAIWHFIGGIKQKNKSEKETITKIIEKETGIKLTSVEFLLKQDIENITEHFYGAKLTDQDVNNMQRGEGQLINFYSISELKNLSLAPSTKHFISKYPELLEDFHRN